MPVYLRAPALVFFFSVVAVFIAYYQYPRDHFNQNSLFCSLSDKMCQTHVAVKTGRDILPSNINVKNYDVTITPDLKEFTFEGKAIIK
jgi:hypothetical protein